MSANPPACNPQKAHRGVHEQITTGPPAVRPFLEDDHGRRLIAPSVAAHLKRSQPDSATKEKARTPAPGKASQLGAARWLPSVARHLRAERASGIARGAGPSPGPSARAAHPTPSSHGPALPPQARWSRSRALIPPRFFRCPLTAPSAWRHSCGSASILRGAAIGVRVWLVHLPGRRHRAAMGRRRGPCRRRRRMAAADESRQRRFRRALGSALPRRPGRPADPLSVEPLRPGCRSDLVGSAGQHGAGMERAHPTTRQRAAFASVRVVRGHRRDRLVQAAASLHQHQAAGHRAADRHRQEQAALCRAAASARVLR